MATSARNSSIVFGIDIGGTGIKGAPVDIIKGALVEPRHRIPTPQPAKPEAVAGVIGDLVKHFSWKGPIGCAFPAVIKDGVAHTAANVDKSWIGTDGRALFEKVTGSPVEMLNDADAAGLAEMEFGAGKGQTGLVVMVTLGTGIGSAIFMDGRLVPNSEIGHLIIRGKDSETRASDRARQAKKWNWKKWAKRVDEYLDYVEHLLNPDLFIIGGGVSKKHEKYLQYIDTRANVVPAKMLNEAGIIGAAVAGLRSGQGGSVEAGASSAALSVVATKPRPKSKPKRKPKPKGKKKK